MNENENSQQGGEKSDRQQEEKKAANILIIDDQEMMLRLLSDSLKAEGYVVQSATNTIEALEMVSSNKPDLIVTDVMMPKLKALKLNGIDFVVKLKASAETRSIPVMMLTGLFDSDNIDRAREVGVNDFLGKPFNRTELLTKVNALLKTKSYLEQLDSAETHLKRLTAMLLKTKPDVD